MTYGIVLIFDEVITGFRLSLGGAQALCGKEQLMRKLADGSVIHAGTMNSGNPSVAAALATLQILERTNPYPQLFTLGEKLRSGFAEPTRHKAFVAGLQEHGIRILARGLWYISAEHTAEHIETAFAAASEACEKLD